MCIKHCLIFSPRFPRFPCLPTLQLELSKLLATVVSNCYADYPEAYAIALKRYRGFPFDAVEDKLPECWQDWQPQIEQLEALQGNKSSESIENLTHDLMVKYHRIGALSCNCQRQ